jgi:C-terminal processing protease CtpA/Prc
LQQLGRVKVVGETSRGGAHGSFGRPVTRHLVPAIATARTVNPVSGSDRDRTGVLPDAVVPAAEALEVAVSLARAAIAESRR